MVVGGCPVSKSNHAELVANLALDMMRSMPELSEKISRRTWGEIVKNINIRIGINSGSLMAGVVGIRNPRFKLFGDTVNVASRMETTNIPGHIQITESTNSILSSHYTTILRGKVLVKGRGEMHTYFLKGRAIQTDSSTSVLLSANNNDSTRNNSIITTTGTTTTTTGTINTTIPTIQNQNEPSGVSHNVTTTPIAAITPTTTTTTTTTTTPMTMPMPMIMPTKTEEENPNHGNCRGSGESSGSGNGSGSGSGSGSVGGKTTSVVERRRVSTSTAETVVARSMRKMSYFDGHRPLPAHASLANLLAVTPSSKEDISSTDTTKTQTISATPTSFETTPSTTSTTMMMMENTNKPTPNGVVIRGRNRDRSFSLTQSTGINAKSFRKLSTQILGLQVNIFDIVEDTQAKNKQSQNQNLLPTEKKNNSHTMNSTKFSTDSNDNMNSNNNAEIMKLPEGLTKTEVFLRIYQRQCPTSPYYTNDMKNSRSQRKRFFHSFLSKEAHEFEENYREENRQRWMRFFRISVVVFLILKPLMTLYQVIRLANETNFFESNVIFTINFCIMFPILSAYLLYTFSPNYREWEQSSFMIMILVIAMILTVEGVASNALGHAYLSVIALYQCYFSNISFILRFLTGFAILGMYLMTYLMIVTEVTGIAPDKILVGRNALYIFIFFGAQAWVVFNSEFKQRINHFREMTLNVQKTKLIEEEARITKLLRNLLPDSIVDRLKENPEATIADFFDNVTVLFTDMVNFTSYSSKVSAMELVQFLNDMYTRFDTITEKENLYKVEIIGDAYFVVGGCPVVTNNHALAVVTAAIDMMAALPLLRRNCGVPDLNIRIGIHTGPVLAGVVGIKDPRYHLFGETVSIAHFLESSGIPGRIQISESTWSRLNKVSLEYLIPLSLFIEQRD
jgi:class 3 adenylate cyclase